MNNEVLKALPTVDPNSDRPEYAILARMDGKKVFKFLLQPTQINQDRTGEYPSTTSGSEVPFVSWAGNQSDTLAMDIPVGTYGDRRDITEYVQSLLDLQLPDKEKFSPPVLMWKWGSRSFSPCVMPRASKKEISWHRNGRLASCVVSITLVKVSKESVIV